MPDIAAQIFAGIITFIGALIFVGTASVDFFINEEAGSTKSKL